MRNITTGDVMNSLKNQKKARRKKLTTYTYDNVPYADDDIEAATTEALKHYDSKEDMMAHVAELSGVPLNKNGRMIICQEVINVFIDWGLLSPIKKKPKIIKYLEWLDKHT